MIDLAIRLQKAADTHCEGLDLPHDLGLVLAAVVESAGVAAWPAALSRARTGESEQERSMMKSKRGIEYDLIAALRRNPTVIQAGDDICAAAADEIERLRGALLALNRLELAVVDLGLNDLTRGWGEPRHRPELGVTLKTTAGAVYGISDAMAEAGRVLNKLD